MKAYRGLLSKHGKVTAAEAKLRDAGGAELRAEQALDGRRLSCRTQQRQPGRGRQGRGDGVQGARHAH